MKRKTGWYAVLAACMVSLLIGCSDQECLAPINKPCQMVLKASAETKSVSRSALSDEGVFSWLKNDKIDVYASDGVFHEFTLTAGEGTNSGEFTGTLTEGLSVEQYAVSPAGLNPTLDADGKLSLTLPDAYTWQAQQTHAVMLSSIKSNNTLSFKNLGGLIKFYIRNIEKGCRIEVTSSTHQLTGTMVVGMDAAGIKMLQGVAPTAANVVTFTSTSTDEKQAFYLPLPVTGEEKMKLNVKVYDAAENGTLKMDKNATLAINRRELILMPSLTFPEAEDAIVQDVTSTEDINAALKVISDSIASTENKDISITINSNSNLGEDEEASATVEVAAPIEIPAAITAPETSGGEGEESPETTSHVKITFDEVPQATAATENKVVLTDNQNVDDLTSTESKSEVEVAIPEAPEGVEPPSFEISLPNTTVTLTATQETATFNEVWATTADNTLNVAKGVTIKNLYVLSGNVKVTGHIDNVVSHSGKTIYITLSGDGTVGNVSGDVVVEHENDKFFTDFANESVANGQNIPYEIATLEHLRSLANRVAGNHRDAYDRPYRECTYLLTNDIDLGTNQLWKPIGTEAVSFSGVFNGNGHKITGVMNLGECDNAGFFGRIYNGGTVQNLTVAADIKIIDETVQTSSVVGALSGYVDGAVFENCHFTGTISINTEFIGGMVGTSTGGTYRLCSNTGSISNLNTGGTVGGIVGIDNNSSLTGCYSTADLSFADAAATGTTGGLIGQSISETNVTACWTNVKMNGKACGALMGRGGQLNITVCYWNFTYDMISQGSWSQNQIGSFGGNTPPEQHISYMNPYISEWGWKYNENGVLVPLEKNTIPSNPIKPW